MDARYIGSAWHGDGWWLTCRHDGFCYVGCVRRVVPSGQVRRIARTLSVRQAGQGPAGTDILTASGSPRVPGSRADPR